MQPYIKANLWHEFSGSDSVSFGFTPFVTDFGGTALELGGGLVASVGSNVDVYGTADYTFDIGGETNRAFEANFGLSVKW